MIEFAGTLRILETITGYWVLQVATRSLLN